MKKLVRPTSLSFLLPCGILNQPGLDATLLVCANSALIRLVYGLGFLCSWLCLPFALTAADVRGYSVTKGEFLLQTGPNELMPEPDLRFSLLASVDLVDFDLATNATIQLTDGTVQAMDNLGDSWTFLDAGYEAFAELNEANGWGDYTVAFATVNEGEFICLVNMPESALPPTPRLVNFADVQTVNVTKPLTLNFDFDAPPQSNDFVQLYITRGHAIVFFTPDLGEPGALDSTARTTTVPADTLFPDEIYSVNLEIHRVVSTNSSCYPSAQGIAATFRSTGVDLVTIPLPQMALLSRPTNTNDVMQIEVRSEPDRPVVLQGSDDLSSWTGLATNTSTSGTNFFEVRTTGLTHRIFRAEQR
jgi:hypothetical protein